MKNGGNVAQAALSAGYFEKTAKNAQKNIVENHGVLQYIASQMERIEKEQHRDIMSLAEIQERRIRITKGAVKDGLVLLFPDVLHLGSYIVRNQRFP